MLKPGPGETTSQLLEQVDDGMTAMQVREIIGEPKLIKAGSSQANVLKQVRDMMPLAEDADTDFDEVWSYGHPVRDRLTYYLGFVNGVLTYTWSETQSS